MVGQQKIRKGGISQDSRSLKENSFYKIKHQFGGGKIKPLEEVLPQLSKRNSDYQENLNPALNQELDTEIDEVYQRIKSLQKKEVKSRRLNQSVILPSLNKEY